MGLPQELIDHIMDMLRDDIPTLKVCSMTCQSMFASARHLIHRTLHLSFQNALTTFPIEDDLRYQRPLFKNERLLYLSYMDEHGLLQYARQVYIIALGILTPEVFLPYHHHLKSLDRVHTLTIDRLDASAWAFPDIKTCFTHFYSTLTSLKLCGPFRHYRLLVRFVTQFPNLQDLCLEWMIMEWHVISDTTDHFAVNRPPPFRGHLRLVGRDTAVPWLAIFVRDVPNVMNFRSVELRDFFWDYGQHLLDPCSRTLEHLTVGPHLTDGTR